MGLTLEQSQEYNRNKTLHEFFGANTGIIAGYAPFKREVDKFNINFDLLEQIMQGKNVVTTGITTNKTVLKHKVADALALVCANTRSYALICNKGELAASMNTREDIIFRMKDADILPYTNSVIAVVNVLLEDENFIDYGVTAGKLEAIGDDARAFNQAIGKANAAASGNTTANTAIDAQLKVIRENIVHFDLLIKNFKTENPAFVEGYHISSAVHDIGTRHSGIEGRIINKTTGEPVVNAVVKLAGTNKSVTTDLNGVYHLTRVRPDDYRVEVTATGYTAASHLHHISRGRVDVLSFELEAVESTVPE